MSELIINVPGDEATIADAIVTAEDGDTIMVAIGTYEEHDLDVTEKIKIKSASGPENTIIDCGNAGYGFNITEDETMIKGFTIKKALDGAILVSNASPEILECIIEESNSAGGVGGISIVLNNGAYTPTIKNTEIRSCSSSTGTVFITGATHSGAMVTMQYCNIHNNVCGTGGGITVYNGGQFVIADSTIENNTETAGNGGGIHLDTCVSTADVITRCVIKNNTSQTGDGGGIYIETSGVNISFCKIMTNNSLTGKGGGIFSKQDSAFSLEHCTLMGNIAATGGGGAHYEGTITSATTVASSIVRDNTPSAQLLADTGTMSTSFSNVEGGIAGTGNIDTNPLFVDTDAFDYHLNSYSPCVGTGQFSTDMGAYQFQAAFRAGEPKYKGVLYSHVLRHNYQVLDFNMRGGKERFNSSTGVIIELSAWTTFAEDLDHHPADEANFSVSIMPDAPDEPTTIGDITVEILTANSFKVRNSGLNATDYFTWTSYYNSYDL